MTVLIGASVLLIAGSAIALVFGWTGADQSLIWTSIAATAAAAVALSLAYFRSRSQLPAPARAAGGSSEPATGGGTATATAEAPAPATEAPASAPEAAPAPAATAPAQEAPAAEAPAKKAPPPKNQVVAIASTKKYHRPDCRYASAASGAKMSKAEARKQSYAPCGVCKP